MTCAESEADKFCYIYSCDLDIPVQVKIGTLEGKRERPSYHDLVNDPMLKFSGLYQEGCADIYVTCNVFEDDLQIALPVRTSYKSFSTRWNWNEWITLPVKYSDLPRNALLVLTIWDSYGPRNEVTIGGSSIPLFGKHGAFRQGMHDLKVQSGANFDSKIQRLMVGNNDESKQQMSRLAKLTKKHRNGHMMKVDWLDRLTFREIELINEHEKRSSNLMYLMIEFPHFVYDNTEYTVVYYEKDGDRIEHFQTQAELVVTPEHELLQENLVESKHHKLARSLRSGLTDKDLKPNAGTRDQLNVIVGYPPTKQLTSEEQDLVWKFRFYLSNQKKALTKFLKCVNWNLTGEARQALELLHRWVPMDVEDALELLSPSFSNPTVRRYAVTRLKQAPDEDLLLYLLQLVQALKYENLDEIKAGMEVVTSLKGDSIAIGNVIDNVINIGDRERSPSVVSTSTQRSHSSLIDNLNDVPSSATTTNPLPLLDENESSVSNNNSECDLATFLITRACANSTLANYFYWYLLVECEEHTKDNQMYIMVMKRFSFALNKGGRECRLRRSLLARQQSFIDRLVSLVKSVAREKGDRSKKIQRLQALLADPEANKINFANFEPLPLPLDPEVRVKSIVPEKATLFKSALMPCRITFLTTEDTEYVTIFKHGDDLRQDQLILQIITLMDKLLRRENLDLKLTPYRVLATSNKHGFVQFIESSPIAEVLQREGTIQNFFRKHAPSELSPYGIASEVMEAYVKSCAGYCVVTYLLGIGDRHFDNLLLTVTGKLFHVDFGYILGRDPKHLPQPPMKLSKEMVEAMGGVNSEHYQEFRKQCYTAFLHLRRHANLILNLFSLMVDANVPDIALEPDKTVKKVQDKFRLDLTDEEAVLYMQNLIDVSVTAVMAALVEHFHRIAQFWRK